MSRFLKLYERFHPDNDGDGLGELLNFLHSKGIEAEVSNNNLCINNKFYVNMSNGDSEEDAQTISTNPIDDDVNAQAAAGKPNAVNAVRQKQILDQSALKTYQDDIPIIQKAIQDRQKRNQVLKSS